MDTEKRKNGSELPALVGFTDADLKLNQEGQLSQKQIRNLRSRLITVGIGHIAMIVFELFIIGVVLLVIVPQFTSKNPAWQRLAHIVPGVLIIVFPAVGVPLEMSLLWDFYRDTTNDMKAGAAAEITGFLYRSTDLRGKQKYYKLKVEDVEFEISKALYDHLVNGDVYRFYYAPLTSILLSMEPNRKDTHEMLIEEEQALEISV